MLIAIANKKGGVGKTTIAVHFALWLADHGYTTGFVDADKQRSSSQWLADIKSGVTLRTADTPEECLQVVEAMRVDHEVIIGDGPAGMDEVSRSLLLLADLAVFPISPSILDLRSVSEATTVLRYAQAINGGRPEGRLLLNKMKTRDTISRELEVAAQTVGVPAAQCKIRELQAYRDAAQQGTVVTRMGRKGTAACEEINAICEELFLGLLGLSPQNNKEVING